jgi:RND family efflux transporter MFP subunit
MKLKSGVKKAVDRVSLRGIIRLFLCASVLFAGALIMSVLAGMKEAPARIERGEAVIQVNTMTVSPQSYPVYISGYGEAMPVEIVPLSPEVSGKVIEIHPDLKAGGLVKKGDLLFKIDPSEFQLMADTGKKRLAILERQREIAAQELARATRMLEEEMIGTKSQVEAAEKAYLSAADLENQVMQMVWTAELNLSRCEVRAGFNGRIREALIEKGQYVGAGKKVVTLVNDTILEIHVAINSEDASQWLMFRDSGTHDLWFSALKKVRCKVSWTENNALSDTGKNEQAGYTGVVDRVIQFNRKTRTMTLAVRVNNRSNVKKKQLPLVDGMFCRVSIPGKQLENVFKLPSWLLGYGNTVYKSVDNRLVTTAVNVIRSEGDSVYISGGLEKGDVVITSRLANPMENSLLEIIQKKVPEKG